jgi:hypothetical protein
VWWEEPEDAGVGCLLADGDSFLTLYVRIYVIARHSVIVTLFMNDSVCTYDRHRCYGSEQVGKLAA